ncbi:CdaR family protein [Spongiimicrobium salis]|uniref:CdaR family protein n=1 Tax=Spongiimicrobium salis TaxID=1667022 RepID=UPI00374CE543
MIKKIKKGLSRRKVKVFLIFFLCSFFSWFISNLSESYVHNTVFKVNYINAPDSLLLTKASQEEIAVKLKASGFQFLSFNFAPKIVDADLSALQYKRGTYFLLQNHYGGHIEKQLPKSIELIQMARDTIFFDFYKVFSKEVEVDPEVEVTFAQNHLLNGVLEVTPKVITVTGPRHEIAKIDRLKTEELLLSERTTDFSNTLKIQRPTALQYTKFSSTVVEVSGKVAKFSEKALEIPVEVTNIPEGAEVRTFPNVVTVICKADVGQLKGLSENDFKLVADYAVVRENPSKTLRLRLLKKPPYAYSVKLMETEVEYILKRE